MATLLLQVAGAALGTALGGPVGGAIGQALGGLAGATVDQTWLGGGGGNKVVEGPRLKEVNGLAATEGAPIPRVYGRARLGGQLIWATRFEEDVTVTVTRSKSGGKGGRSKKPMRRPIATTPTSRSAYARGRSPLSGASGSTGGSSTSAQSRCACIMGMTRRRPIR